MNLITAVIFNSMFEENQREQEDNKKLKEQQWNDRIGDLHAMFTRMDMEHSGYLTKGNVVNASGKDIQHLCDALGVTTAADVFKALDVDNTGRITINNFYDQLLDAILGSSDDLKRLEKQIESMHWRLKSSFSSQHDLQIKFDRELQEGRSGRAANRDMILKCEAALLLLTEK